MNEIDELKQRVLGLENIVHTLRWGGAGVEIGPGLVRFGQDAQVVGDLSADGAINGLGDLSIAGAINGLGDLSIGGSIIGSQAIGVRMYRGAGTIVPHGTVTPIRFTNSVGSIPVGMWAGAGDPSKLIAPVDGWYIIGGSWFMPGSQNTAQVRQSIFIYKNGVNIDGVDKTPLSGKHIGHSMVTGIPMVAGDYVEINIYHEMGADKTIPGAGLNTLNYQSGWIVRVA